MGGYRIDWTFTVPAGTPDGWAMTYGNCSYNGAALPNDRFDFQVQS
ncbi:MAG: hypothetical protein ACRDGV_04705 [Candidatus Limnocylindria bacterium]